ncbi:MAG: thiamine/thiamine pyrophosphate ABC transporter permease ThiP [Pseudooceanicola sp.]|nr:thiamine/thiamine pyrophosphate ABC transporter permease ThiP [Pseudooceanicola sp.]
MAWRAQPVISPRPGVVAAIAIAALMAAALGAVLWRAEGGRGLGPADWAALRFTVAQAVVSALFSVALAVPVARALARRQFMGRSWLITLLGAPFILPVIVAVIGLLAVFGRNGWISTALGWAGFEPVHIYGFHGVVLAHVFFNLPLATRLVMQGWADIPAERFLLAAQVNADARAIRRLLEYPMLRQVLPGALAVIFAVCLTSFAVALMLGGGPRATTIELAIYQAFRFDFDLGRAALLALVQVALTLGAALLALRLGRGEGFGAGLDRPVRRWDANGLGLRVLDAGVIALAAAFLLLPMGAIFANGLAGLTALPNSVFRAAGVSLGVALASAAVLLLLALPMAIAAATGRAATVETAGLLGLAVSSLVLGTGLFILIHPIASPAAFAWPVTALVNALMALPFALRILIPPAREVVRIQGRLAQSLAMPGLSFLRLVLLPRLRRQIGFAAGLGASLSMGDLGVIALFADADRATLPLQIYRLMGAYQMQAAAGGALLLLVLSLALFRTFDWLGGRHADA